MATKIILLLRLRLDSFDKRKWNGTEINLKSKKKRLEIWWVKFNNQGEIIKRSEMNYIQFQ